MKNVYLIVLVLLSSTFSFGQDIVASQNFDTEDTWSYTAYPESYNFGDKDVWSIVESLSSNNDLDTPVSGTKYWGMRDLDNSYISDSTADGGLQLENPLEHTLTFENISVAGKNNVVVSFYYNAYSLGETGYISVEYFVDDASLGKENVFNGQDNGSQTEGWAQFRKEIDDGSSNVRLTIYAYNDQDYLALDNFVVESGAPPICEFLFGDASASCDAITEETDTYTASIPFTGGGSSNFTISASSGEVGGDDPSAVEEGTIIVSGINEGLDLDLTVQSELCDLAITVSAPNCVPPNALPFEDVFNYEVESNLTSSDKWLDNDGGTDEIMVAEGNLSYDGLIASTGNSVAFAGEGNNAIVMFENVTSGAVYASFIFKVTDMTGFTKGGYFAVIGDYNSRLYVKPDTEGSQFQIGLGNTNKIEDVAFDETLYNIDQEIFIVMNVDIASGYSDLWVNPGTTDIETDNAPASNISFLAGWIQELNQFILRQDSETETPGLVVDELRIGESWAEVTPAGENNSVSNSSIEGLKLFPNPVLNGIFYIQSKSLNTKLVTIYDLTGNIVLNKTIQNNDVVKVDHLSNGVYFVKLTENENISIQKLIIR